MENLNLPQTLWGALVAGGLNFIQTVSGPFSRLPGSTGLRKL